MHINENLNIEYKEKINMYEVVSRNRSIARHPSLSIKRRIFEPFEDRYDDKVQPHPLNFDPMRCCVREKSHAKAKFRETETNGVTIASRGHKSAGSSQLCFENFQFSNCRNVS